MRLTYFFPAQQITIQLDTDRPVARFDSGIVSYQPMTYIVSLPSVDYPSMSVAGTAFLSSDIKRVFLRTNEILRDRP